MKKPSASSEASPYKSLADELEILRKTFRSLAHRYTVRVEAEINVLRETVLKAAPDDGLPAHGTEGSAGKRPSPKRTVGAERQAEQIRDLRDMLTLLRTFEVSSGVAKRRDFKSLENILEELRVLTRRWM